MPTLAAYLASQLSDAGLEIADVSLVEWQDTLHGWLAVDRQSFVNVAATLDVADVAAPNRERLRFAVVTNGGVERKFRWDGGSSAFVVDPEPPAVFTMSAADLTG